VESPPRGRSFQEKISVGRPRARIQLFSRPADPNGMPASRRPKVRVLCVDDDPHVVEGLALNLRRHFEIFTALSGAQGLGMLEKSGDPVAVVISDMRMPQMTGAAFLAQVRQRWPDTVRILLTGQTDLDSAVKAVNEGQIFRFLSKPCPPDHLLAAVEAGVEHHRLVTAERVLLEQTLHGAVKALTDILSLQNPLAFGRATRAKAHVSALAAHLGLGDRWQLEVAAMLSPIGTITLPPETLEKVYDGRALSESEQAMVSRAPAVAQQLLGNIPRLEPVCEILAHLETRFDGNGKPMPVESSPVGARLLKIVLDYDALETRGLSEQPALDMLRSRRGVYDLELLAAFASFLGRQAEAITHEVSLARLLPGMVFLADVRSVSGALLIARGHEVTPSLLERIRNFSGGRGVVEPLRVLMPPQLVDKLGS
jgi:response regulator RpfG family c-di-GMP phosphodiesterase